MTRLDLINTLIDLLVDEMPHYADQAAQVPATDEASRRALLRALMNVRPPRHASERFIQLQDELLRAETEERGVVEPDDLPRTARDPRLALWRGDITRLATDAIVNAANSALLGCFVPLHRCIDNVIHSAAGVQLRLACDDLMVAQGHEEPTGRAKVTAAYNLPAKFVVHAVGPIVHGELTDRDRSLLADCYRASLDSAAGEGCESIVFCCISTGEFRFPHDEAARIAVDTARAWLDAHAGDPRNPLRLVVFDVFGEQDERLYRDLLGPDAEPARA
ncbi:MAG: protein-ADP-ribose hydrolase [Bifidobacterium sp.]|nr:protein-ADP-ribose hydrolase [Bifidobacterium sp.]